MKFIIDQLDYTLNKFDFNLSEDYYSGKVRENYYIDDKIVMITTDRVSAFDHILGTIPFKGEVLTQIAKFWFEKTKHIAPNHYISNPDPQVLLTVKAKPLPVEIIIRGYITGSLWREYSQGINGQYGFMLPNNLKQMFLELNSEKERLLLLNNLFDKVIKAKIKQNIDDLN